MSDNTKVNPIKMGLSNDDMDNINYIHKRIGPTPNFVDSVSWALNFAATLLHETESDEYELYIENKKTGKARKINVKRT